MATHSLNYVIDQMRTKGYTNWRVKSDGTLVNLHEGKEIETSISELKKLIEDTKGGIVEITISSKTGAEKNQGGDIKTNSLNFFVELENKTINGIKNDTEPYQLRSLYEELAKQKYLNIIANLEKENEELKQELEDIDNEEPVSGIGTIMEELRPYIKPIVSKFLNNQTLEAPSSINDNVAEEQTPGEITPEILDQVKKCAVGGKRVLKIDKHFGDRVLMLALLAEKDYSTYEMACNMLNSMAQKLQENG